MPAIAFIECVRCRHRVSAATLRTLCPLCAGSLYVRYDMEALKRTANRDEIAPQAAASPASLGMWRYAAVLPEVEPVTLGEGWTPMLRSKRYPGLYVKEEGANPTGTFAARGLSLTVSMARHHGFNHLAIASSDDAAGTLAAYAAAAGMEAHLFMPRDVSCASYIEGIVHGADVTMVDGSLSDCAHIVDERIQAQTKSGTPRDEIWANVSTLMEPYRIEGTKTVGYELVEQLGWTYPDAVFHPIAADWIGMCKAFEEMEQLGWVSGQRRPRLYTLQARGLPEDSLILDVVHASGGKALAVSTFDDTFLESLLAWARQEGLLLSPEGASAAAAYDRLLASGELKLVDTVVLVNPATGLRSTETLAKAMHLRRPDNLPTSAKVGGIITPI